MTKDTQKPSIVSGEEYKEKIASTAKSRIESIRNIAANLFVNSLVACAEQGPSLSTDLWAAQNTFFSELQSHIPISIDPVSKNAMMRAQAIDLTNQHLIVIANHPPFEKTVSPSEIHFLDAMHKHKKGHLIDQIGNLKNLPAGIVRRAVINRALQAVYPDSQFRYHVVGSRYRPPLNVVQERDGTIVVPYAQEETNGFDMLYNGLRNIYAVSKEASYIHVGVAFPEGEHPKVIEELRPFHSGIFAVAKKLTFEDKIPIVILPMIMVVLADFSIHIRVLSPLEPNNDWGEKLIASTIQRQFQSIYQTMLQSLPDGYYWKGMTYPYGGITRNDILDIPKNN